MLDRLAQKADEPALRAAQHDAARAGAEALAREARARQRTEEVAAAVDELRVAHAAQLLRLQECEAARGQEQHAATRLQELGARARWARYRACAHLGTCSPAAPREAHGTRAPARQRRPWRSVLRAQSWPPGWEQQTRRRLAGPTRRRARCGTTLAACAPSWRVRGPRRRRGVHC